MFEHAGDLRTVLTVLLLCVVFMGMALAACGIGVWYMYKRPPTILCEDEGKVYWRTTEFFKLRHDNLTRFLKETIQTILTLEPGVYDLSSIRDLISSDIEKIFSEDAKSRAENMIKSNRRQTWTLLEFRRVVEEKRGKYIKLVIRGEQTYYTMKKTDAGVAMPDIVKDFGLYLAYLKQEYPTPGNPFGLRLCGLEPLEKNGEKVWESAVDVVGTVDLNGKKIEPPKVRNPILGN